MAALMFKNITFPLCSNKYLHTFRYAYAQTLEIYSPLSKLIFVGICTLGSTVIGLATGGLFLGMASLLISSALSYFLFVDALAFTLPIDQTEVNILSQGASLIGFFAQEETYKKAQEFGENLGEKVAGDWNSALSSFLSCFQN